MASKGTDPQAADYGSRVSNIVVSGFASLGLALGKELGLFKAMDELGRPATAADVARVADCKERYVREWLLQMSMARVVEMDDTGTLFNLPQGGMEALNKVIHVATYLPRVGLAHLDLVEAFKAAGPPGIPVESAMALLKQQHKSKAPFLTGMFTTDASEDMAGIVAAMKRGATILDIGCSTGALCTTVASQFPKSTYYGIDILEADVNEARKKAADGGISNALFEVQDAAQLPDSWSEKFDVVLIFDTFHDLPFLERAIGEFARVLKKGGTCFISENLLPSDPKEQKMEFAVAATMLYTFSLYHCVPLAMNHAASGGKVWGTCMGKERARELMEAGGFECISLRRTPCSYSADRTQHLYRKK